MVNHPNRNKHQATPRPFRVRESRNEPSVIETPYGKQEAKELVLDSHSSAVIAWSCSPEFSKAVCKAVNNHEALIGAINTAIYELAGLTDRALVAKKLSQAIAQVEASK